MKRLALTAMMVATSAMLFTGCGSGGSYKGDSSYVTSPMAAATEEAYEYSDYDYGYTNGYDASASGADYVGESAATANRKLITTGSLDLETTEYDTTLELLQQNVNSLGGYIESMNNYNGSAYSTYRSLRYSNLTVRIPAEKLNEFLGTVSELANITSRSQSIEDVTLNYVDLQVHVDTLRTEQDRLLSLMEQAEDLESLLIIEERLTEVSYQIESYEKQLRTYDNKINYSTINIYLNEVEVLTPIVEKKQTAWEQMSEGFMNSVLSIGTFLKNFFIGLVIDLPYLVLVAMVCVLAFFITKKIRKKNEGKVREPRKTRAERKAAKAPEIVIKKDNKDE